MSEDPRLATEPQKTQPRAVGAPLSRGNQQPASAAPQQARATALASPDGSKASANSAGANGTAPGRVSGMQRAAGALRAAVPFVQRLLPLLEGNIAGAVSNILAPQQTKPPAAPTNNLSALEDGMAELHLQQHALNQQIAQQQMSLKRVEDRLEGVREATDRNTLEQQELLADLKSVGRKVNTVAIAALLLLVVSILLNLFFYLHIVHVLP